MVQDLESRDVEERYREEAADDGVQGDGSPGGEDPAKTIISWDEDDKDNPYNWPNVRNSNLISSRN
jgi:hypothetical protein